MALLFTRRTALVTYQRRCYSNKTKMFDILFMGRDEFSCGVFRELYASKGVWNSITIATHPYDRSGRGGSELSVPPLRKLGDALGVPVDIIPKHRNKFKDWPMPRPFLLHQGRDPPSNHVLVTASFGRVIPLSMLSQFPESQRLNVHPSLLPAYRGPAPIQHALMKGEKETGVCVISTLPVQKKGLGGGIDAGDIWACTKQQIPEGADFAQLRDILAKEGGRLLTNVLLEMIEGTAKATPQPEGTDQPFAPMISRSHWTIDFSKLTADQVVWRHRAVSHQRPLTVAISTKPIRSVQLINPSTLEDSESVFPELPLIPGSAHLHKTRGLQIRCKDDTVIKVAHLKQEGKRLMSAKDWWNGANGLGVVVDSVLEFRPWTRSSGN